MQILALPRVTLSLTSLEVGNNLQEEWGYESQAVTLSLTSSEVGNKEWDFMGDAEIFTVTLSLTSLEVGNDDELTVLVESGQVTLSLTSLEVGKWDIVSSFLATWPK